MFMKFFKRQNFLILISILVILLVLVNLNICAKTITLKLAEGDPPTSLVGVYVNTLIDEVEARTNGEVKIEPYWSGSLLAPKEILKGIEDNVVEMGKIVINHFPQELFANGVFSAFPRGPLKFENIYDILMSTYEKFPIFYKEWETHNQKLIGIRIMCPTTFFSIKKVTKLEDLKGQKFRVPGVWWKAFLKGAGLIPVDIPLNDTYLALSTGNVDGVYSNIDGSVRMKLYEPANNVFLSRELWTPIPVPYTINLDVWNRFTDETRQQIKDSIKAVNVEFSKAYDDEWDRIVTLLEDEGCIINSISDEDIEKWVNMPIIEEMQEKWIADAKEKGISNAEEIIDSINKDILKAIAKEK